MINVELYNGNCLEVMKTLSDQSIDMVLCDLPYGTTQCKWDIIIPFDELWKQYNRIAKENAAIVLFGTEPFSSYLRLSNIKDYRYDIIWDKIKGTGFLNAKKQPMRNHENISIFYKKQCTYNPQKTIGHILKQTCRKKESQTDVYGILTKDNYYSSTERYPRSIQIFSTDTQLSALHPTQKPVKLLEWLVLTYSNIGDTVLDNCMGSGSTGIACKNTGRNFVGIELDNNYFEIAKERIENHKINKKLF